MSVSIHRRSSALTWKGSASWAGSVGRRRGGILEGVVLIIDDIDDRKDCKTTAYVAHQYRRLRMAIEYQMLVGGSWVDSSAGDRFPSMNPFNQESWASIPQATQDDVDRAVSDARNAFESGWRETSGLQRATLMMKLADLLDADASRMARLESTDNGKVIRETKNQMHFAARSFRFLAGYADKLYGEVIPLDNGKLFDYTLREPLGVVALLTAWNSPISLLAYKLAPALAAGNCVVIKPSEHASPTPGRP